MPRQKTEMLTVWGAVNDDGKILVSSISAYRSVASRWALKYRNHHVERLCDVPRSYQAEVSATDEPKTEIAPIPVMLKAVHPQNRKNARMSIRKRMRKL